MAKSKDSAFKPFVSQASSGSRAHSPVIPRTGNAIARTPVVRFGSPVNRINHARVFCSLWQTPPDLIDASNREDARVRTGELIIGCHSPCVGR